MNTNIFHPRTNKHSESITMCCWIKTGKESTKMMPAITGWWYLGYFLPNFGVMVSKPAMLTKQPKFQGRLPLWIPIRTRIS